MLNFAIVPASPDCEIIEITALCEVAVLHAAQRLGCQESDVFEGGGYRYSLRLTETGGWLIFQRDELVPMMRLASA